MLGVWLGVCPPFGSRRLPCGVLWHNDCSRLKHIYCCYCNRVYCIHVPGHKTPTQSKRKRTGKKGLKGHGPEHVYNTLGYITIIFIIIIMIIIIIRLLLFNDPLLKIQSSLRGYKGYSSLKSSATHSYRCAHYFPCV